MRRRRNDQWLRQPPQPNRSQSRISFDPIARNLIRGVVCTWCVVGLMLYARTVEASFGHEHVHIRVHVPEIKTQIHHTEKTIVKEIPIIRHHYIKKSIAGATHTHPHQHLRSHLYREDDDGVDDDEVYAGNVRGNHHVVDEDVDEDDSVSYGVVAAPPAPGMTWSHGFHHRNSFAIDGDAVVSQPSTVAASSSYSPRSNLLRLRLLEQRRRNKQPPISASLPLIWNGRPFAMTSTSTGRDHDDYPYPKTWTAMTASGAAYQPAVTVVASDKGEKNVSALYKIVKDYAPWMAHPHTTVPFEPFDRIVGGGGESDAKFRQNFVDYYYHTAPEVTEEGASVNVVDDVDDDDDDDDNSKEFASFAESNWNKLGPKSKNYL